ncbi:MAG TPA: hypothetical protein VD866_23135 [Urbifossiella sp.]|nr:hypothetical protein [Urbifossiella sp.]
MRPFALAFCVVAAAALPAAPAPAPAPLPWPAGLPVYDHVVIVVEENKDYDDIIGNASAPYINKVLRAEGANLTRMFGEEHNSQGNYYWLFSAATRPSASRTSSPARRPTRPPTRSRPVTSGSS